MDEFNNPDTALPSGNDVVPVDGVGNDSNVVEIKDVLSELLGRQFPTNEAALKSVKDTYNYVGKAGQEKAPVAQQIDTSQFVSRQELESEMWYKDNKDYAGFRDVISKVQKAEGFATPAEAIEKAPYLKNLIEKAQAHDTQEKSKSVLVSNPRIGQATNKVTEAKEALSSGNISQANQKATEAVMDAFEL